MKKINTDICVIGAGAGGLSVAAGAVQLGVKVILLEHGKMGGDCLNYGCVPSKAILAAAKHATQMRHAGAFGLTAVEVNANYAQIREHIKSVIAKIAPNDSEERFRKLGVDVIRQGGKFINKREIAVGDTIIRAKRFVIATGSSAAIPPIQGLDRVNYLTNETIFELNEQPQHLIIIGGGAIGCEMAQAHLLLGTKVTMLEAFKIMPRDDTELVGLLKEKLQQDGLQLQEGIKIINVNQTANEISITIEKDNTKQTITGSHLLMATGRRANIDNLDLEKAAVKVHQRGITVNKQLRTSNRRIYAIGDVVGPYQFTHMAAYHAGIVIRNIVFHLHAKVNYKAVPWTTYTDPELAHVGMSEEEALAFEKGVRTLSWPFTENDRAQTELATTGKIKVHVTKKGHLLGVSILGKNAGELLTPWTLAINKQLKIADMANIIIQYPTFSEISKRVASSFYTETLFSAKTRFVVRLLNKILP